MKIKRILLDIDGVCNRFHWHIFNTLGLDYEDDSFYPRECGWDIVNAANVLLARKYADEDKRPGDFTPQSFWRSITREMWGSTPTSMWYGNLLGNSAYLVGQENVFFLTSPTIDPECMAGKLDWIQRFSPKWMHRQFLVGPPKQLCARPDHLLVDDSDKNCDAFRAEGGKALLLPRPWNRRAGECPIKAVNDLFQGLFDQRLYQ